jgi:D-alanine-D-alanine ligase-like ATP-grasp enzyme
LLLVLLVLVQKAIAGIEIGCGILGNEQLTVGACDAISLVDGFFDFEEKYQLTAQNHCSRTIASAIESQHQSKSTTALSKPRVDRVGSNRFFRH